MMRVAWVLLLLCTPQDTGTTRVQRLAEDLEADDPAQRETSERLLGDAGESARTLVQTLQNEPGERGGRGRRIARWLDYAPVMPPADLALKPNVRHHLVDSSASVRRQALFEDLSSIFREPQGIYGIALDDPDSAIRVEAALHLRFDPSGKATKV